MSRSRASAKQAGTRFESSLVGVLAAFYPGAERRARNGSKDRGDFNLPGEDRFILEAKNVVRQHMPAWLREAQAEAVNAGVPYGVVVHKRHGNNKAVEQYVTMDLYTFLMLVAP